MAENFIIENYAGHDDFAKFSRTIYFFRPCDIAWAFHRLHYFLQKFDVSVYLSIALSVT